MKKIVIAAGFLVALSGGARAQTPAPSPAAQTYRIELTSKEVDSLYQLGAACLERVPYACASYFTFVNEKFQKEKERQAASKEAVTPPEVPKK